MLYSNWTKWFRTWNLSGQKGRTGLEGHIFAVVFSPGHALNLVGKSRACDFSEIKPWLNSSNDFIYNFLQNEGTTFNKTKASGKWKNKLIWPFSVDDER